MKLQAPHTPTFLSCVLAVLVALVLYHFVLGRKH